MRTRLFVTLMAAAALALPAGIGAQQQGSSGGATGGNSSQGTPSASGGAGQSSQRQGSQGQGSQGQGSSTPGRSSTQRGAAAQDRSGGTDNNDNNVDRNRSARTQSDTDSAIDRDATDTPRTTTNRIDAGREDRNDQDLERRDRSFDATDRDASDRFGDRDDHRDATDRDDRFGDQDDRGDRFDDRGFGDRDDRDRDRDDGDRNRRINFGASFSTNASDRLVIRNLVPRGVFARAGFRDDDVIISINGQRVVSEAVLHRIFLGATGRVPVIVLRDGEQQTIYVDTSGWVTQYRAPYRYEDDFYETDRAWLGVFFDTRYDNAVVVQAVQEGSAADDAGIRAGDRLMSINGRRVQSPSQVAQIIGSMEPGERVEIDVARWQSHQVEAQLGERPATSSRFRYLDDNAEGYRETFRVQP